MKIVLLLALLLASVCSARSSSQGGFLRKNSDGQIFANSYNSQVGHEDADENNNMPLPFQRELFVKTPPMEGSDVYILQNFLSRFTSVNITRKYDATTSQAVKLYQSTYGLSETGKLDVPTAQSIMNSELIKDNFKYNGFTAASMGYQYLIHIPVRTNRSIETIGTLYDANGKEMMVFHARLHGDKIGGRSDWCETSNIGSINQFTTNGATPTGLSEIDYQSPFPSNLWKHYGKYPIQRIVRGLEGNAAILMHDNHQTIRSGILLHTGEWEQHCGWNKSKPMPNSLGCVHIWPEEMARMEDIMRKVLDIKPTPNTSGQLPFPYKPRGLMVVELVD